MANSEGSSSEGEEEDEEGYRARVISWGPEHPQYEEGVQCHLEAGDLFLWDSRAMVSEQERSESESELGDHPLAEHVLVLLDSMATAPRATRSRPHPNTS
jgi:hypothetical protein